MQPQPPNLKISRFYKFKKWLKKHWIVVSIVFAAIIIASAFVHSIMSIKYDASAPISSSNPKPKPAEKYYSALSGQEVPDESAIKDPVTAVMIENSLEARPQSGLKQAEVVYEAVAEGGITRFMALYQQNKPELIGPVRSLRLYYLDWAAPFQASIAHVGGSRNALAEVKNGSYRDIDQYSNADTYWRSTDRYAPHNMYTSFERIDAINKSKGYEKSIFASFKRSSDKPSETPNASSIVVNFSGPLYNTSYAYNTETNSYLRNLAGEPHNDKEHGQITPKVVIVLQVDTQTREGDSSNEDIVTSGSGQAHVFQNGTVQEAIWQKSGRSSPLELVDTEGESIKLNRGQTWISAITNRGSVSWQ